MSGDTKPDIVILTTHDTGRHLGGYVPETVHSETIDAIASGGCLFTGLGSLPSQRR